MEKNRVVRVYCKDGVDSEKAADFLMEHAYPGFKVDMFINAQNREYYYAKPREEYPSSLNPVVLVVHIDESNEEHLKKFEFLKKNLLEGWIEYASKEEADKYVDKLFKNNIPYIEERV